MAVGARVVRRVRRRVRVDRRGTAGRRLAAASRTTRSRPPGARRPRRSRCRAPGRSRTARPAMTSAARRPWRLAVFARGTRVAGAVDGVGLLDRVTDREDDRVGGAQVVVDEDAAAARRSRGRRPGPTWCRGARRSPRRRGRPGRVSPVVSVDVVAPIARDLRRGAGRRRASRMRSCTGVAISGSSGAMTWSAASTRVTSRPRWTRFSATSTPMKPPPTTTAVRAPRVGGDERRRCPRRRAATARARCRGSAGARLGRRWRA